MTKTSETRAPETRAPETTSGAPALFYHLTMSPPETLLTTQLTRAQAQGWRALLLVPSRDWAERFDIALWRGGPESFLAHGIAGGPQDADQPVLIRVAQQGEPVAGFEIVISLGAVPIAAAAAKSAKRLWILFDGNDPQAVDLARGQWRELAAAGVECQYWAEGDAGWERRR